MWTLFGFLLGCMVGFAMSQIARRGEQKLATLRAIEEELDHRENNPHLPADEVPALILRDLIEPHGSGST